MKKELIITKEDIELLKEMKENCLKSSVYDDEKRLLKANVITKFLNLLDTNKNQKKLINKAIELLNAYIGVLDDTSDLYFENVKSILEATEVSE